MKTHILIITTLLLSLNVDSMAQNSIDFQKMRTRFESRRANLDTMTSNPSNYNLPYFSLSTLTTDSVNISSWFIPNDLCIGTIIMVHGFDMNKSGMLSRAKYFHDLGFSILLPDLRARGESGGDKASRGATNANDIEAIYKYYMQWMKNYGKVTFYGFSHGGRAILFGSSQLMAVEDIILESIPYNLASGLKRQFGINLPMPSGETELLKSIEGISSNKLLLMIGDSDTAIIEDEAKELYSKFNNSDNKMIVFENTGHAILSEDNKSSYHSTIHNFLNLKSSK